MIRMTAQFVTVDAAAGDTGDRTITGVAVPWNVTAQASSGPVLFLEGSLPEDGPAPKLIAHHDPEQVHGIVTERVSTSDGMMFSAKIARTRAADDIVELLKMGAIDAVSVGAEPTDWSFDADGTMVVKAANWVELSLVTIPAFADARIATVAAQAADQTPDIEPEPILEEDPEVNENTPVVEAAAVVPTTPIYAMAAKVTPIPSASEYVAAAMAGGDQWRAMSAAIRAAAPDVVTTDTPGLLPTPIVGPLYNNFIGRRPVVDAVGVKAMPGGGKVFIRPEVTTHTSMAVQSAENAALQSGTFVVFNNQVTKAAYGGYVTISEQDIDWTDPNVISLILDDMARIYANATDNVAADNLVAGATVTRNFTAVDIIDPDEWTQWAYGAAATILSSSNGNLPTHLFMDPATWASLGGLVDTAGRPLFPQAGPMNAFGGLTPGATSGNAFGMQVVVDRNFAAQTLIIGNPEGFEIFEQQKGALSIDVPSTMSRTIAWRGYFATLMIDSSKFVKAAFV